MLPAAIGDFHFSALLDSGAGVHLISQRLADRLPLRRHALKLPLRLHGVSSEPTTCTQYIRARVAFGKFFMHATFRIAPFQRLDMILGYPFFT